MASVPLDPAAGAVLDSLAPHGGPTLGALAAAVAGTAPEVVAGLATRLAGAGDDARAPIEAAALLDAARREAELFGDNHVRREHLLLGALRVLGDEERLRRVRAEYQDLTAERVFGEYARLSPYPRPDGVTHPRLILMAGLPGTGKSTLAENLARALPAPVFSMDWQVGTLVPFGALRQDNTGPIADLMLVAAAARQLQLGLDAIVDATGYLRRDRRRLRTLAEGLDARFVGVECRCSDERVQRDRVEGRDRGIPGWPATVSWAHVNRMRTRWEPWEDPDLVLDSALLSPEEALRRVREII